MRHDGLLQRCPSRSQHQPNQRTGRTLHDVHQFMGLHKQMTALSMSAQMRRRSGANEPQVHLYTQVGRQEGRQARHGTAKRHGRRHTHRCRLAHRCRHRHRTTETRSETHGDRVTGSFTTSLHGQSLQVHHTSPPAQLNFQPKQPNNRTAQSNNRLA